MVVLLSQQLSRSLTDHDKKVAYWTCVVHSIDTVQDAERIHGRCLHSAMPA
jgi:hypothetical protein